MNFHKRDKKHLFCCILFYFPPSFEIEKFGEFFKKNILNLK